MFRTFKTLSTSTFVREKTKTVHPLLFVVYIYIYMIFYFSPWSSWWDLVPYLRGLSNLSRPRILGRHLANCWPSSIQGSALGSTLDPWQSVSKTGFPWKLIFRITFKFSCSSSFRFFMNVNVAEGVYISGEVLTLIFKVSRGWILMYFDSMTFILSTPAGRISSST